MYWDQQDNYDQYQEEDHQDSYEDHHQEEDHYNDEEEEDEEEHFHEDHEEHDQDGQEEDHGYQEEDHEEDHDEEDYNGFQEEQNQENQQEEQENYDEYQEQNEQQQEESQNLSYGDGQDYEKDHDSQEEDHQEDNEQQDFHYDQDEQNEQNEDYEDGEQQFYGLHSSRQNYRHYLFKERQLNEQQKKYLRDIYDQAQVKYYKQEFKLDSFVRKIFPLTLFINARQWFQILERVFAKAGYHLCQISIKTYVKDNSDKQKKFEAKLDRIERAIQSILKKYCYKQYSAIQAQNSYKSILISQKIPQFIHFTLKIPVGSTQVLKNLNRGLFNYIEGGKLNGIEIKDTRYKNKDYLNVSNNSFCNKLKKWDIGCRVQSQKKQWFYSYFYPEAEGERFITFSRSMQKEQQSDIREICIYNSFNSNIVFRTVIKKQQIYLLSYSQDKNDIYIFLSSPPIYEFSIIPPNAYCLPNYLNNWQRVQNFLFLKHRDFKNNDFLRLFLYSNSYMHIQLDKNERQSCQNIRIDIDLIQKELNCRRDIISKDIEVTKIMPMALKIINAQFIKEGLKFIQFTDRPILTEHTRWKVSYQIMLLIRFNVITPNDLEDILTFIKNNQSRLTQILEYLSRRSVGYTNKIAGINRSKDNFYQKLKTRLIDYLEEDKISIQRKYQKDHKNSCLIYKVSLTPSGILPNPISFETKCRLIRQYQDRTEFFLKATLLDDAGQSMKNQRYIYNKIMRTQLDRVNLLGKVYLPLGWSGSQLRGSSLWYVSEIFKDQEKLAIMTQESILKFLGDFSKIPIAAKKAARIGQAFSASYCYDSSQIKQKIVNDDLSPKNFMFTDGIGKISKDLFEAIRNQFKQINVDMNCCLQIRYKGAKGVLLLNELLQQNTIVLRESMVKYDCNDTAAKKYLDILSWDKYLPGYLNRQIIILLRSLNISDQVFLQFQRTYIKYLNQLDFRGLDGNLLKIFNDNDQSDSFLLTISKLKNHFDLQNDLFFQQILESVKDNKFAQLKKKSRILIQKSARLIGVIDDYDILQEDQLYCCIKKQKKDEKREVIEGYVVITRNPSLDPADIRKCRCLSEEEITQRMQAHGYSSNYFAKFANCIVFPKKGMIPLTAQISGSDLDGDIFFICWDDKFIIKQALPCETIDDPNKKSSQNHHGQIGYRQMLDFFVSFANNEKLGRINNLHTVFADKSQQLAKDKRCKRLAAIHGKAVDYAKSGQAPQEIPKDLIVREYPDFMEKWNKPTYKSTSILGKLYRQSKDEILKRKYNQSKKKLQFDTNLTRNITFSEIKQSQIRQIISQLKMYEQDITELMLQSNLTTQFQLYAGSNSQNQQLKNEFGRKRLADWLKEMRDIHQERFFRKCNDICQKYKILKSSKLKKQNLFPKDIIDKAILCYVISYFCYCLKQNQETIQDIPKEMKQFCNAVMKIQQKQGYEGKYLGFIWVIIPKVIINIKLVNE